MIIEAHHLLRIEIDDRAQALDGPHITVVVLAGLQPTEGVQEPLALFLGHAVVARRPGIDHDEVDIGDAAFLQRFAKARIGLDRFLAFEEFLEHDARLNARDMGPARDLACRERDDGLVGLGGCAVEGADERLPRHGIAGLVGAHQRLVGLLQHDGLEAHALADMAGRPEEADRPAHLVGRQWIEGVSGRGLRHCRRRGFGRRGHRDLPVVGGLFGHGSA